MPLFTVTVACAAGQWEAPDGTGAGAFLTKLTICNPEGEYTCVHFGLVQSVAI